MCTREETLKNDLAAAKKEVGSAVNTTQKEQAKKRVSEIKAKLDDLLNDPSEHESD